MPVTLQLDATSIFLGLITLAQAVFGFFAKRWLDRLTEMSRSIEGLASKQVEHGVRLGTCESEVMLLRGRYEDLVGFLRDQGFRKREG